MGESKFDFWVKQFLGQTLLTSRPNSGLLGPLPLATGGLTQKKIIIKKSEKTKDN
jgi:hypothetical protein